MTFDYKDDPLNHPDAQFINRLYYMRISDLMKMSKDFLLDSIFRAKLVGRWLEGTLALIIEKEAEEEAKAQAERKES